MNSRRFFQGLAIAVLAIATTAPALARDDDRGRDRGRQHYDRD